MSHRDYYSSVVPGRPPVVLGLRLLPFSLGHLLLLHRVESNFVESGDIRYEDLALSVLICSQPFKEAEASLSDPDLPRFMALWAKRLIYGKAPRSWFSIGKPIDLHGESELFTAYMRQGVRSVSYATKGEGREIGLPLVQLVRVTLLREFGGLSDEALMNRPWGLCLEDYVTIHALDGNVDVFESGTLQGAHDAAKAAYEKLVADGRIKVNGD